jgi:hypothetical protein
MVHTTWHGALQNASRGASTLLLIAANLVIALWFAAEGRRGWAWFYGAGFPVVLAALTAVGFAASGDSSAFALAILATPWILVTALAIHLYQREANRRNDFPAGLGAPRDGAEEHGRSQEGPRLASPRTRAVVLATRGGGGPRRARVHRTGWPGASSPGCWG